MAKKTISISIMHHGVKEVPDDVGVIASYYPNQHEYLVGLNSGASFKYDISGFSPKWKSRVTKNSLTVTPEGLLEEVTFEFEL